MSPHVSDFGGDIMSPIMSPPATPSQIQDTEHIQPASLDSHRTSALQNAFRRRNNIPTLKLGKDDTTAVFIEDENEVILNCNNTSDYYPIKP